VQLFYDGFTAVQENIDNSKLPDRRLCLEVARNFRQISNPRYQEALHLLVRSLAH
jgi:hypothetical protein